jgi:hypothetical protein
MFMCPGSERQIPHLAAAATSLTDALALGAARVRLHAAVCVSILLKLTGGVVVVLGSWVYH